MLVISSNIPQTDAPAGSFDQGTFKNDIIVGDGTGTPLISDWPNDLYYALYSTLNKAGITPSGSLENSDTSDFVNALQYLISRGSTNINTGVITTNTTLTITDLGTTYEVDCSSGDILIILPILSSVSTGIKTKFYKTDTTNNKLTIQANGTELINTKNSHIFYGQNSNFIITRYLTKWMFDDYYDAISQFVSAYFSFTDTNQSIVSTTKTVILFPTIQTNIATIYNSSTGVIQLPLISGTWQGNYSIYTTAISGGIVRASIYINSGIGFAAMPGASVGSVSGGSAIASINASFEYLYTNLSSTIQFNVTLVGNSAFQLTGDAGITGGLGVGTTALALNLLKRNL